MNRIYESIQILNNSGMRLDLMDDYRAIEDYIQDLEAVEAENDVLRKNLKKWYTKYTNAADKLEKEKFKVK